MPAMDFQRRRGLGGNAGLLDQSGVQAAANLSLVLIVCSSPINRIVVSLRSTSARDVIISLT